MAYSRYATELKDKENNIYGIMDEEARDYKADAINVTLDTPASVQSFPDGADNLPMALTVGIEPVQDLHGYENPWPAGGGKNLFNKDGNITRGYRLSTSGTGTQDENAYISDYIAVAVGSTYTKNSPTIDAYHRCWTYDENKTPVRRLDNNNTITIESGEAYIRFCGLLTELDTAQFEVGSSSTSFAPYSNICPITGRTGANVTVSPTSSPDDLDKEVYSITFPQSAGTVYGGTVTVNKDGSGSLVVDRKKIDLKTIDNSNLLLDTTTGFETANVVKVLYSYNSDRNRDLPFIASEFTYRMKGNTSDLRASLGNGECGSQSTNNMMWFRDDRIVNYSTDNEKFAAFKSLLTDGTVVYPLSTPITYTLTAEQVKTLFGVNNVWADTGDILSVTYPADTKLYIDKKFAELSAAITALGT